MKEGLQPPLNQDLLQKQIGDQALNNFADRFNAFMKMKGLEEEFANFRLPVQESPVIAALRSHKIVQRAIMEHIND